MVKKAKKAFTIVELVIVIAVVAILMAVLIPTFVSLVKKANVSSDTQLVRNLNTALRIDGVEHKTMTEALAAAEESGFDVEKISAKVTENEILWDSVNDCFVYMEEGKSEPTYIPESKQTDAVVKNYQFWQIADAVPASAEQKYSVYLSGTDYAEEVTVSVGFDAGRNANIPSVTYTNGGEAQNVVIRTNGGTLIVNGKSGADGDTVQHHYIADSLTVNTVGSHSYHEYGTIRGVAILNGGHSVIEAEAVMNGIEINQNADVEIVSANSMNAAAVVNGATAKLQAPAGVNVYSDGAAEANITGGVSLKEVETVSTGEEFCNSLYKVGNRYIKLVQDIEIRTGDWTVNCGVSELYIFGNEVNIDLNGHELKIPNAFTFTSDTAPKVCIKNGSVTTKAEYYGAPGDGFNLAPRVSIFGFDGGNTILTLENVTVGYAEGANFNCSISVDNGNNTVNIINSKILAGISLGYGSTEMTLINSFVTDTRARAGLEDLIDIANSAYRQTVNVYSGTFEAIGGRDVFSISSALATLNIYGGNYTWETVDTSNVSNPKNGCFIDPRAGNNYIVNLYDGLLNGHKVSEIANDRALMEQTVFDYNVVAGGTYQYGLEAIPGNGYRLVRTEVPQAS